MELQAIVERYAEAISAVDQLEYPIRANPRNGQVYLPGVPSMTEANLIDRIDQWWEENHPSDFSPAGAHQTQVPYPGSRFNKCDQVLTSDGRPGLPEWAIEAKYLRLIGDNGKRNDYATGKALSPYLKDRSLYHDVERLRAAPIGRRCAAIAICFNYSLDTCDEALTRHPEHHERIQEIASVCRNNGGNLSVQPLADFANGIFGIKDLVIGPRNHQFFEAWRHPCGGKGVVFGWEIKLGRTDQDGGYW